MTNTTDRNLSNPSQELVSKLAQTLNVTETQAQKMIIQEAKRKAAGERYRQSQAYRTRLEQQKLVRLALKEVRLG